MKLDFENIAEHFEFEGKLKSADSFGMGHINDTYKLVFESGDKENAYVLQRVNHKIFPCVEGLMNNISLVTEHIRKKLREKGKDEKRGTINLVHSKDGKPYYKDENGNYFKAYVLIDNVTAYQIAEDPMLLYNAGVAFGEFISMLRDFPAEKLYEVIPDFHNTKKRFEDFTKVLQADSLDRAQSAKKEINFVLEREKYVSVVTDEIASGGLSLRVTHNDTKLNNILLDNETGKGVCVIDLDTIMPGSILYDFGDAIRAGCNTGMEDEKDLSKVSFSLVLFEQYAKGFIEGAGNAISEREAELLPFSAILMTFECGIRFLGDYLAGDTYFKTQYPEHNLVRSRTQFKMVSDMENMLTEMKEIVSKYYQK